MNGSLLHSQFPKPQKILTQAQCTEAKGIDVQGCVVSLNYFNDEHVRIHLINLMSSVWYMCFSHTETERQTKQTNKP